MGAMYGPVGELREFRFSGAEKVSAPSRVTRTTMLSGLVRAQYGPRSRRSWDVESEMLFSEDWAGLEAFTLLPRDLSRPCWFLPQAALSSNMIPPEVSLLADGHRSGGSVGGPSATLFTDPAGYQPVATATDTGSSTITIAPSSDGVTVAVPHNRTFTASVYFTRPLGNQDSSFRVQEIDQTGAVVTTHYAVCRTDDALTRLHITATTQVTTVALRLLAFKSRAIADPCVTLTDRVLPYAVGRGCARATIERTGASLERATSYLHGRTGGRVESASFIIQEVG